MALRVEALGHVVQVRPPEGLDTEVSNVGGHLGLYNGALIKTLDTKVWVSFAGWRDAFHGVPKSRTRPSN